MNRFTEYLPLRLCWFNKSSVVEELQVCGRRVAKLDDMIAANTLSCFFYFVIHTITISLVVDNTKNVMDLLLEYYLSTEIFRAIRSPRVLGKICLDDGLTHLYS